MIDQQNTWPEICFWVTFKGLNFRLHYWRAWEPACWWSLSFLTTHQPNAPCSLSCSPTCKFREVFAERFQHALLISQMYLRRVGSTSLRLNLRFSWNWTSQVPLWSTDRGCTPRGECFSPPSDARGRFKEMPGGDVCSPLVIGAAHVAGWGCTQLSCGKMDSSCRHTFSEVFICLNNQKTPCKIYRKVLQFHWNKWDLV